jgi:hypothetical protein
MTYWPLAFVVLVFAPPGALVTLTSAPGKPEPAEFFT